MIKMEIQAQFYQVIFIPNLLRLFVKNITCTILRFNGIPEWI